MREQGIKNKVKTYGSTIYVTLLSPATKEIADKIQKLETALPWGASQNETNWDSGKRIEIEYKWEPSEQDLIKVQSIFKIYESFIELDRHIRHYHLKKIIKQEMGLAGYNVLNHINLDTFTII